MKFPKFFTKKEKEIEKEKFVESKEALFSLFLKGGLVDLEFDWGEDFDIKDIGLFLGSLATQHIFNLAYQSVSEYFRGIDREDQLEIINQAIKEKIEAQRLLTGIYSPVVPPENAIRHQMVMYSNNQ